MHAILNHSVILQQLIMQHDTCLRLLVELCATANKLQFSTMDARALISMSRQGYPPWGKYIPVPAWIFISLPQHGY